MPAIIRDVFCFGILKALQIPIGKILTLLRNVDVANPIVTLDRDGRRRIDDFLGILERAPHRIDELVVALEVHVAVLQQGRLLPDSLLLVFPQIRQRSLERLLRHAFSGERLARGRAARLDCKEVLDGEPGSRGRQLGHLPPEGAAFAVRDARHPAIGGTHTPLLIRDGPALTKRASVQVLTLIPKKVTSQRHFFH